MPAFDVTKAGRILDLPSAYLHGLDTIVSACQGVDRMVPLPPRRTRTFVCRRNTDI